MSTKKRCGRQPPKRGVELYTGCARMVRYRDGKRIPCDCVSCVPTKEPR